MNRKPVKILFPTNFGKHTEKALEFMIYICKKTGAEVLLTHVIDTAEPITEVPMELFSDSHSESEANDKILLLEERLKRQLPGVSVKSIVYKGLLSEQIKNAIETEKIDYIILGIKERKGIKAELLGRKAEEVLSENKCPVFVINEKSEIYPISQILFTTDYEDSDIKTIQFLSDFASIFKAEIVVLNIFEVQLVMERMLTKEFENMVREQVSYPLIQFKYIKGKNIIETLENYLKTNTPDLVVMSSRQRKNLQKLFETSITKEIIFHSKIPALAFHKNQD